jgi:hypothetical protein
MSSDRGCVLLCVHGDAPEVPAVTRALRDRWGVEAIHLDPARFPTGFPLSLEYAGGDFAWRRAGREATVSAVWQGVIAGRDLPAMDPAARRTCAAAAEIALLGLLDSSRAFQLDPRASAARAENKPHQLRVAQEVGLDIPATLVSNDAQAVRDFAARRGPLVTKMLVQPAAEPGEEDAVVFTSAVSDADLADLAGLELCPMIFQERIANRLDVRVAVIGRRRSQRRRGLAPRRPRARARADLAAARSAGCDRRAPDRALRSAAPEPRRMRPHRHAGRAPRLPRAQPERLLLLPRPDPRGRDRRRDRRPPGRPGRAPHPAS